MNPFLVSSEDKDGDIYLKKQRHNGQWCDEPRIRATAGLLDVNTELLTYGMTMVISPKYMVAMKKFIHIHKKN